MGFWNSIDNALFGGPGECGGIIGNATNKVIDSIGNKADAVYEVANEAVDKFNENPVGTVLDTAVTIAAKVASGGFTPKI